MKRTIRILLASTAADQSRPLLKELETAGLPATIHVCEDWGAASQVLSEANADLLICDSALVALNGQELFRILQERELPLILFGSAPDETQLVEWLKGGARDFVPTGSWPRLACVAERELRQAETRRSNREAEASLAKTEPWLGNLMASLAEGVAFLDERGVFRSANAAARLIFGLPESGLVGRSLGEFVDAEVCGDVLSLIAAERDSPPKGVELGVRRDDGSLRQTTLHWSVLPSHGWGRGGFCAVFRETSELRRARRDEEARQTRVQVQQRALLRMANHNALVTGDFETAVRVVAEETATVLSASEVSIWVLSDDAEQWGCEERFDRLTRCHTRGPVVDKLVLGDGLARLQQERVLLGAADFDALSLREAANPAEDGEPMSLVSAAQMAGRVEALLVCVSPTEAEAWGEEDIRFATEVANQISKLLLLRQRRLTEQALRENEAALKSIFRAAPTGIGVMVDGVLRLVNEQVCVMLGYQPSELLEASARILYFTDEEFKRATQDHLSQFKEFGVGWIETQWRRKDGRTVDVLLSASPIDPSDMRGGITFVALDITDRKRAQTALLAQLLRNELILKTAGDGFMVADLEGNIQEVNPAFSEMLGYAERELLTMRIDQFDRQWATVRPSQSILEPEHAGGMMFESTYSRKDGRIVDVEVRANLLKLQGQNLLFCSCRDVTERNVARGTIQGQAALLDVASDAIVVLDLTGVVAYWNRGAEKVYGWVSSEATSKVLEELVFPGDTSSYQQARLRVAETGSWTGEFTHLTKARQLITVQSRWTLVRDRDDQPKSILTVSTDITEQKRLQAQFLRAQRLESVGTLASGIAHDLNNVLTPISMSVHLLKEQSLDESGKLMLSTVETCARRGTEIVRQLLTFARGAEGTHLLLQPKHLLQEMARIAKETFPRSIQVYTDYCRNPWLIRGDATQLQQVLMNLCVNARDAMPQGGILSLVLEHGEVDEAKARLQAKAQKGPHVVLAVVDSGSGIPPELRDKIFDPFFTTKPVGQGTGLGLPTVLGIVEAHGGFVEVESEVGRGTRFSVYLPAVPSTQMDAAAGTRVDLPAGRNQLVLVVDDEQPIRSLTQQMLTRHGYRVLLANGGHQALETYTRQASEIDLVITDLMMPFMDGMTLVKSLRSLKPDLKIVVVSGIGDESKELELKRAGAMAFLTKPYSAQELLQVLHDAVGL